MLNKNKEIENIWNHFEHLVDDYADFPEVNASHEKAMKFLEDYSLPKNLRLPFSDTLNEVGYQRERQGFFYGFQYAVRLLGK